jgi:hypothetical protein
MGRQWPSSMVNAQRALGALVALMALGTVMTVLLEDSLIRAWAERSPAAREILEEGGIDGLRASSISLPAFVPVVVVMFVVLLCLLAVLRVFFREGYEWARLALAGVAVLIGLGSGLIAFREDPPAVFVVLCVLALVVDVAFLVLLFHRDTTDFIRGAWLVHHDEAAPSDTAA